MSRAILFSVLLLTASCGVRDQPAAGADSAASDSPAAAALPVLTGFGTVRPVDEAPRDSSLVAFRDTIIAIARRRDTVALRAHISANIKYSLGNTDGQGFFAYWREHESLDRLWTVLEDVVAHGGRFNGPDSFVAPWTFNALPDSLDPFDHLVVRDTAVAVRDAPAASATPTGTLSYAIVRVAGSPTDSAWIPVSLPDGRTVYVEARHVRHPVDHRIGFSRSGNRWVIDFFVAGD